MLCKLLLFTLLVSVYEGKKQTLISKPVESEPIRAGEAGPGVVKAQPQVPLALGARPSVPPRGHPGPMNGHNDHLRPPTNGYNGHPQTPMYGPRRPTCPFPLPVYRGRVITQQELDGSYEDDPIKKCITGCWVNIGKSCVDHDVARHAYANCIIQCYKSNGDHIDFALWQALYE